MMPLKEEDFVYEFAKRTLENYDNVKDIPTIYEVTLLINSAVGLLFIPKEQKGETDKYTYSPCEELLKELQDGIKLNDYNERGNNENFSQIVRHIRNGIAHGRFEFEAEKTPGLSQSLCKPPK